MASLKELEVYAKTVYTEARGESVEEQIGVEWVIKNRAFMTGKSIKEVCLRFRQFECWNGKTGIEINEIDTAPQISDPTGGATHYNNPNKEGYPEGTEECEKLRKIGNHQFYTGPL